MIRELREIAEVLETGPPVSPVPAIPQSVRHILARPEDRECQSDDEIPF